MQLTFFFFQTAKKLKAKVVVCQLQKLVLNRMTVVSRPDWFCLKIMSGWCKGQTYPKKKYYIENGLLWTRFKKLNQTQKALDILSKFFLKLFFLLTNVSQKILKINKSNNGLAMMSCPYQGLFIQSTKSTETYEKNCQKCFSGRCMLCYLNAQKIICFNAWLITGNTRASRNGFVKIILWKYIQGETFRINLHRWNNSYSQPTKKIRVKGRITNSRYFVVPITLCQ